MINNYLNEILFHCAEEFSITIEEITSKSRRQEIVYCRKAFCRVVKEKLDVKNQFIAQKLNCSGSAVSAFLRSQPENRYYAICLNNIRSKICLNTNLQALSK